jgi:hypothetical protein
LVGSYGTEPLLLLLLRLSALLDLSFLPSLLLLLLLPRSKE